MTVLLVALLLLTAVPGLPPTTLRVLTSDIHTASAPTPGST